MKIAILGYGIEGESAYRYYAKHYPESSFIVYDANQSPKNPLPDGVEFVGGVENFFDIDADVVIKTPAIAPWRVSTSGELTTVTRELLKRSPATVIGVTGTKGKGTTSSLIDSILTTAGKKTWLVGNIGKSPFDVLDEISADDIVIYEMSSFQLWNLDVSPHTAVVLGIEPEHLDVHKDLEDYLDAKANITTHQTDNDTLIYKDYNTYVDSIVQRSMARKVPYQHEEFAHVKDGSFYYGEQKLCSVDALKLPGAHNLDNACAAIDATWQFVQGGDMIARGLSEFSGLPHRLKFVKSVRGVDYYDDSIATTPGSVVAALNAFDAPKVVILGGSSKGADYMELAQAVSVKQDEVRRVIVIGVEANKIVEALSQVGFSNLDNLGLDTTMKDVVELASRSSQSGDVVILSPSCASFDMFKNYQDRGDQFIAAVQNLD